MERRHAMTARRVLVLLTVLVLGAATPPEHAAGQEPVLEMDAACGPPAVRPNEDALLVCTLRLTNRGSATATGLNTLLTTASGLNAPDSYLFFARTVDGRPEPVGVSQLTHVLPDLAPGKTLEVESWTLVRAVRPGAYGATLRVQGRDGVAATTTVRFDVSPDAPDPPSELVLESVPPAPPGVLYVSPAAPFTLVVRNRSGAEVRDVTLLHRARDGVHVTASDPPAATDPRSGIASWDLGTLRPGQEVRLHVTLTPDAPCPPVDNVIVATGPVDGEERAYAAVGTPVLLATTGCYPVPALPPSGMGPGAPGLARPAAALLGLLGLGATGTGLALLRLALRRR